MQQTIEKLQRKYFWPQILDGIQQNVRTCHTCQVSKPNLTPRQPPLGLSATPEIPYESFAFDLIGPLPTADKSNQFAFIGVDLMSKKAYGSPYRVNTPITLLTK